MRLRMTQTKKFGSGAFVAAVMLTGALTVPPPAQAATSPIVGVTAAAENLPTVLGKYPRSKVTRIFFGKGEAPRWSDSGLAILRTKGMIPFVSLKDYNPTAAKQFVDSMPADVPVLYLTYMHEPEQGDDKLSASTYKSRFCKFYRAIKSSTKASRVKGFSVQTRQWTENGGHSYGTYYPGNDCTDGFGVDMYADSWRDEYPNPASFLSKVTTFARSVGKPLVIAELGAARLSNDPTDAKRAAWIKAIGIQVRASAAQIVIWWHELGKGKVNFRLNQIGGWNDPCVREWRNVIIG